MSQAVTTREAPTIGREERRRLSEGARAERRFGWLLCAPAVIVMGLVAIYPIAYAVYLSLQRYDLRFPQLTHFVGLSNYATVLTNGYWWHAFIVTLIITIISVAVELVLGMALALLMHRTLLWRGVVRTSLLIPYGIVTVAVAFSWQFAWTPQVGYLIGFLHQTHLTGSATAPLTSQIQAIAIIILAEIWKTTPFMALLLLAGLALVPEELLRAARVDGATPWQRFTQVMLPLMKPAILVALLFRTLDAFRIFDNIFILTSGNNGTGSVSILGYDNLFTALNLGIGSTISVLIFISVAIIAFIFIRVFGTAAPGTSLERR
jgi:multiple sugar transport system permease protein